MFHIYLRRTLIKKLNQYHLQFQLYLLRARQIAFNPVIMPMDLYKPEVSDNKKTEKYSKRTAPRRISNRIIKKPRLVVSNTNVAKSTPSKSNAVIQSTNEELQLKCMDNYSHLDNDNKENEFYRKHSVGNNLLHHLIIDNDDTTEKSQEMVDVRTVNGNFWFNQSLFDELYAQLLEQSGSIFTDDEEEDESIIKSSPWLQLPKVDSSCFTSTNSKKIPASPITTSSEPIDVPLSSINSVACEEPQVILLSSEDEDEESLEPIISKTETKEPRLSITKPTNGRSDLLENTIILEDKLNEQSSVIKISDYRMLNRSKFINDILIEFYLNYWYTQKLSDEDRNRTYVFSTYFYTTLAKSFNSSDHPSHYTASQIRHNKVKKWTKNVDIFKKDFVFIPINENNHWFMAVVCFPYLSGKVNMKDGTPVNAPDDNAGRYTPPPTHHHHTVGRNEADPNVEDLWLFDMASTTNLFNKQGVDYETDVAVTKKSRQIQVKRPCILLFDSLSGGVQRAKITATIRDWLEQEYIAKHDGKEKDFSPQAIKGALLRLPQQPNLTDCGLFVIHFFKRFFERPIVDYTLPIRHLENWFSIDEVVKNCQKRRELQSIILTRMEERGSILPDDKKLPILDFTDPHNSRL